MLVVVPLMIELFVLLIRPQEIAPALQSLSPIYATMALSIVTLFLDRQFGHSRPARVPLVPYALALWAWALFTVLVARPDAFVDQAIGFSNALILFLMISHGLQTFRALARMAVFLFVVLLFLAYLGVNQGLAPRGCHRVDPAKPLGSPEWDGRFCENATECSKSSGDPEAFFRCEHIGLLGTSSIADRVRYRGLLEDPNELSLTTTLVLPFAFALFQRKKSVFRFLLLATSIGLIGMCTVFSQSRGGQIVFLVVIGTYGLRLFGTARGLGFAALMVVPMMMLGGRSGDEAEASSLERLGCWKEGIQMLKSNPLLGVGKGQFTEHHFLTAHNSYILVAGELGFPGYLLFTILLYLSIKIAVLALRQLEAVKTPEAEIARIWTVAFLASISGATAGIFFLSLAYHPVIWLYLGLAGALATAVRGLVPTFEPRVTGREVAAIIAVDITVLILIFVYATKKGA